jgi:hypothetical protein
LVASDEKGRVSGKGEREADAASAARIAISVIWDAPLLASHNLTHECSALPIGASEMEHKQAMWKRPTVSVYANLTAPFPL